MKQNKVIVFSCSTQRGRASGKVIATEYLPVAKIFIIRYCVVGRIVNRSDVRIEYKCSNF